VRRRVIICEPEPNLRRSLVSLLDHEQDLQVAGEAKDGPETQALTERVRPDIVFLADVLASPNAIRLIKSVAPRPKVIVLATYPDGVASSLAAGADNCVLKGSRGQRTIDAIRKVLAEELADQAPHEVESPEADRPHPPTAG